MDESVPLAGVYAAGDGDVADRRGSVYWHREIGVMDEMDEMDAGKRQRGMHVIAPSSRSSTWTGSARCGRRALA